MSPQEQLEFNEMKRQLEAIRQVLDVPFIETLKTRINFAQVESGASLSGMTIPVRNSSDSGSEDVADDYTGALTLTDSGGNNYKIGYY